MSHRPDMVASELRSVIAPILRECPLACGLVSITRVEVSPDLGVATFFVSALKELPQAVAFLEEQIPGLKRQIGKRLWLRRVPQLRFRGDEGLVKANAVDKLL